MKAAETTAAYVPFSSASAAQAIVSTLPPMEAGDSNRLVRMNFFMNGSTQEMLVAPKEAAPNRTYAFQMRHPMQYNTSAASDVTWALANVVNKYTKEQVASWVPEQTPDINTPNPRTHVANWKWNPDKPDVITDKTSNEDFPNATYPENQVGYGVTPYGEVVSVPFWLDPTYAGNPYPVELDSGDFDAGIFNGRYYFTGMRDYLRNEWLLTAMDKLSKAYLNSGDPVFAEYFKEILIKYAERYRFMMGARRVKPDRIGSYVFNPMLDHIGSDMKLLQRFYRDTGYGVSVYHYQNLIDDYDRVYRDDTFNEMVPGTGMSARDYIESKMFAPMAGFEWDSRPIRRDLSSNIGDFGFNTMRAAIVMGRPDLARFGAEYLNLNLTGGMAGSDRISCEGPGYTWNWWINVDWTDLLMMNYEDPPGYVDENGLHLQGKDYRTVRNFARARESHWVFNYPDGRVIPVHDVENAPIGTPKGVSYASGPILETVTRIAPGFGHTVLGERTGNDQIQAHLHWSGAGSHTQDDNLSLGMYAFGRELYGDPGYNWYTLARSAVGHNTVTVNGNTSFGGGLGQIGDVHYLAPTLPGMKVTRVSHLQGSPNQERFRRTLALNCTDPARPYLVDVFEVFGGTKHEWMLQGAMRDPMSVTSSIPNMQPYDIATAPSYFGNLTNMFIGPVQSNSTVTMRYTTAPTNAGVILHLANDQSEGMNLLFGRSPVWYDSSSPTTGEPGLKNAKVILQRTNSTAMKTVFVVVHEPFKNGTNYIQSVSKQVVQSNGVPVALGVTVAFTDGRTDYHLFSLDSQERIDVDEARPMSLGPLTATASYAAAVMQGTNCDLYMVGGTQAGALGKQLTNTSTIVTGAVPGTQRSFDLTEYDEDGFISDINLPLGDALDHEMIYADFLDASNRVAFVAGFEIKRVTPRASGVFISTYQDLNIAYTNGVWKQLSPGDIVREAPHIRLRYVPSQSTVPIAQITPNLGRWELERPTDTLPVYTDNITVGTRYNNGNVRIGVGAAPSGIVSNAFVVTPGQISSTGTAVNAQATNVAGVMISPIVTQKFRNLLAAQSPAGARYPGLFSQFSQGGGVVSPDVRLPEVGGSNSKTNVYTGYIQVPTTGIYYFRYVATDGVLKLDGQEVGNSLTDFSLPHEVGVTLAAGLHAFVFSAYWDPTTFFSVRTMGDFYIQWKPPGESVYTNIPANVFTHTAAGAQPSVTMSATQSTNDPMTYTFAVTSSDDGNGGAIPAANMGWDVDGDGYTDFFGVNQLTYPFPTGGSHTVQVVVFNAAGERATAQSTVDVTNILAALVPVISLNTTSGPGPLYVQADGSGSSGEGGIVSYAWDFGDGATATGPLANHSYTTAGNYTITLTVEDTAGQTGSTNQLVTVTSSATSLASTLYLKLDETNTSGMAMDSSGNGFHATYNGGMTSANVVTGYSARALQFDGANDYLSIPYQSALNTTNFSVSVWFKQDVAATTYQRLVSSDNGAAGSGQAGYSIMLDGSAKLRFRVGAGSSWSDATTAGAPATGVWHHVAAVYDGTTARVYVDGVEAASRTTAMAQNTTKQFAAGVNNNSLSAPFDGVLDEIRFCNYVLTTNQVTALWQEPPNQAPIVTNQSLVMDVDKSQPVTLTGSDSDLNALTYTVATQPSHGNLSGTPPFLTYTPAPAYQGSDSFTFLASDGWLNSPTGTISITVTQLNDPPVANNQSIEVDEDGSVEIVLGGYDAEGDPISFQVTRQPAHGTLTGTPPNLTYLPASNFHGVDDFGFVANDGQTNSAEATVSITVNAVNDAPVADGQTLAIVSGTPLNLTLTGSDVDSDPLTFSVVTPPVHGTLSGTPPALTYTSDAGYSGPDAFTFAASDGQTNSAPATVSIDVISILDTCTLWLKLDETNTAGMAMDSSANGFHASYNGGITDTNIVTGRFQNALAFDGIDDFLSVPYQAALNPTNFSVSLWFRKDAAATTYQRFMSSDNGASGSGQAGYSVMLDNANKLRFRVGTGSAWSDATVASVPAAGAWHHVVAVYDGTVSRVYVDGEEAATKTTIMALNTNKQFAVGANNNSLSAVYEGALDDIRIYDFALGTNEVAALYLGVTTHTLMYVAGANGTIIGTNPQTVNDGGNGVAVTAMPNSGYYFVNWSDASTANPRTDTNVTANITVTATFAPFDPPAIGPGFGVSDGNFNFQFTGTVGGHYRVEYTPALPAPVSWQVVTDIVSLATSPCAVSIPTTNTSGFYRVGLVIP